VLLILSELVMLQARLGIPTGCADIGLEPSDDTVAFLRTLQRDFVKVQQLLQLIVEREQLKREQVCYFVPLAACSHYNLHCSVLQWQHQSLIQTSVEKHSALSSVIRKDQ